MPGFLKKEPYFSDKNETKVTTLIPTHLVLRYVHNVALVYYSTMYVLRCQIPAADADMFIVLLWGG